MPGEHQEPEKNISRPKQRKNGRNYVYAFMRLDPETSARQASTSIFGSQVVQSKQFFRRQKCASNNKLHDSWAYSGGVDAAGVTDTAFADGGHRSTVVRTALRQWAAPARGARPAMPHPSVSRRKAQIRDKWHCPVELEGQTVGRSLAGCTRSQQGKGGAIHEHQRRRDGRRAGQERARNGGAEPRHPGCGTGRVHEPDHLQGAVARWPGDSGQPGVHKPHAPHPWPRGC